MDNSRQEIDELTLEARRRYYREWRKKNPDKVRANNKRYWAKKAKLLADEEDKK